MVRVDDEGLARVRTRPHPVHFAGAAGCAGFVAFVVALFIRHNDVARSADWMIVGIAAVVAACRLIGPMLRWLRTWVELDASVARCTSGVVWPATVDVDLDRARALGVEQSL